MKLADMKRTKAEAKSADAGMLSPPDDYSYRHRISLDHNDLSKIGVKGTPKPGDEYHGQFHGRVTHSSESASEGDGTPTVRIEVLMHHLGMEPKGAKEKTVRDDLEDAAADKAEC